MFADYPADLETSQPLSRILSAVFCFTVKEWKVFSDIHNFCWEESVVKIQGNDLTQGSVKVTELLKDRWADQRGNTCVGWCYWYSYRGDGNEGILCK